LNARVVLVLVVVVALGVGAWFFVRDAPPEPVASPASLPVAAINDDGSLAVHSVDLPEVTLAVFTFFDGTGKLDRDYTAALPRFQQALGKLGLEPVPTPWLMAEGSFGDTPVDPEAKNRISFATPVPEDIDRRKLRAVGLERHVIQGGGGLRLEIEAKSLHGAVAKADGVLREASAREGRDILARRWFRPLPTDAGVRFEATADMRDEGSVIDAQGPQ